MTATRRQILAFATALTAAHLAGHARGSGSSARAKRSSVAEFLEAVQAGELGRVRALLEADPSLASATDAAGRSAFVLAHLAGQPEIAGLLLERGLELDIVEAVLAEDWERVEALAAAHPELVDAAHPIGGTPLHAGALAGSTELYRLRYLGCDPDGNPPGGSGFTPARAALECRELVGARIALADLLGNGSSPNAPQRAGDSILHAAVRRRSTLLVRLALRKGVDVTARDEAGRTPRALADELGWAEGEALLRDHARVPRDHRASQFAFDASRRPIRRPDLSDVSQERQSAVTGNSHARIAIVRGLLAEDARLVFSISTDDELAIEACGHTSNKDIIRLHLDHGAPLSLPTAISLGDAAHARFLLERDPLLVHERGPHDFALMWYPAIHGGSPELAELLLEAGTPVDQESVGTTCLHWAASRGQADLARLLLERGAAVDAVGHRWKRAGETPLQVALEKGHDAVARLLRDAGAKG